MTVVTATLVKHKTDDGLVEFFENVPIGQEYLVDLDTRRKTLMFNLDHQKTHEREIIFTPDGRWLPMECLKLRVS